MQILINKNGGAYPIIFASLASSLVYIPDIQFLGNIKLGQGGKKMLLGDDVQTWAQNVDSQIQALVAWAKTGLPSVPAAVGSPTGGIAPYPGTPAYNTWQSANLSQNHQLD
jgi:hypothetical protein